MLLRGGAFEGHGRGFLQFQWLGIDCDGREGGEVFRGRGGAYRAGAVALAGGGALR